MKESGALPYFWIVAACGPKKAETKKGSGESRERKMKKKNIAEKLFGTISELERMKRGGAPLHVEEKAPSPEIPEEETPIPEEADENEALALLGRAFLERLSVPEGMTAAEAALTVVSMWDEAKAEPAPETGAGERESLRLPEPLSGGLADAPEADYDSMSAEQFRRLTKQLRRASRDGRKIRL